MREMINSYSVLLKKRNGRDQLEDVGIDEVVILKCCVVLRTLRLLPWCK